MSYGEILRYELSIPLCPLMKKKKYIDAVYACAHARKIEQSIDGRESMVIARFGKIKKGGKVWTGISPVRVRGRVGEYGQQTCSRSRCLGQNRNLRLRNRFRGR